MQIHNPSQEIKPQEARGHAKSSPSQISVQPTKRLPSKVLNSSSGICKWWFCTLELQVFRNHLGFVQLPSAIIVLMNLNFPTKKRGNLKSASIWVNYNNSPTWIELTLVLPPIQSTWGEVTWDQFAQVLALICLDQVLCTVDIASQKRGNYKQCQWLIYKFIHVFTLPLFDSRKMSVSDRSK